MFCAQCGNNINNNAKFCGKCGKKTVVPPAAPKVTKSPEPVVKPPEVKPEKSEKKDTNDGYKIFGENFPAISVKLKPEEAVSSHPTAFAWLDGDVVKEGKSDLTSFYKAREKGGEIIFAASLPGCIVSVGLNERALIANVDSFICATSEIKAKEYIPEDSEDEKREDKTTFMKLSGKGKVFLQIAGSLTERVLATDETVKVNDGNLAAFDESVKYSREETGDFSATKLTGPGKVWLKTIK